VDDAREEDRQVTPSSKTFFVVMVPVCLAGFPSLCDAQVAATKAAPNDRSVAKQQGDSSELDERTRGELVAAREAIWRAWFENDTIALARLLPAAAAAGEPSGWEHRDAILAGSRAFVASGTRFVAVHFTNTRFHLNGDVAVLFSDYTIETEREGKRSSSSGRASEVFVRTGGVWRNPFWYLAHR
jgi:hypothetical protein